METSNELVIKIKNYQVYRDANDNDMVYICCKLNGPRSYEKNDYKTLNIDENLFSEINTFKNEMKDDSILDKPILDYIIEQVINDKVMIADNDNIIDTYLEIISSKEFKPLKGQIKGQIKEPLKESIPSESKLSNRINDYPSKYIADEDINIPPHDFIISRSLKFSKPRSILNDNIKRYLDLGCYTIFSNISSGESSEEREERFRNNPNLIPEYEIYSTIDQIQQFSNIDIDIDPYIFISIPIMFDLINVIGNGYCFLNCFYIFTTITYGASRLTKLYNGLSNFRQRFLNLRTQPSNVK
jgi:hypothetical protein